MDRKKFIVIVKGLVNWSKSLCCFIQPKENEMDIKLVEEVAKKLEESEKDNDNLCDEIEALEKRNETLSADVKRMSEENGHVATLATENGRLLAENKRLVEESALAEAGLRKLLEVPKE